MAIQPELERAIENSKDIAKSLLKPKETLAEEDFETISGH